MVARKYNFNSIAGKVSMYAESALESLYDRELKDSLKFLRRADKHYDVLACGMQNAATKDFVRAGLLEFQLQGIQEQLLNKIMRKNTK